MIEPDWPAPARVRALVTTRDMGDMGGDAGRQALHALLPSEARWTRQVHGIAVSTDKHPLEVADAAVTMRKGEPRAITVADCMPVFLADDAGTMVGVAHAGWRGLAGGVLEATVVAMRTSQNHLMAWLGPAIGPAVYEIGKDVFASFPEKTAFAPNGPGHWLLDLYAVARSRLQNLGVRRIYGGGFCTYSQADRFYSYRRDRTGKRMAAAIWLT